MPGRTYSPHVIINAISYYNLGHTLEESAKLLSRRFKGDVSPRSVHEWLNKFKEVCNYHRIRIKILKKYGKDVLISKVVRHRGLTYKFKYHRPKLETLLRRQRHD